MTHNRIKDVLRENIVKNPIQILQNHNKSECEIKEIILKDFALSEEKSDELMKQKYGY